jgi:tetratricopeptide (TPR) repeat protein
MKNRHALATMITAALAIGCHSQSAEHATLPSDASADKFEKVKDPPIKAQTYFAAGQLAESQGDLAEAISQYKRALKEKSDYLEPMYHSGIVYAAMKDYKHAIATWNRYIVLTGGSGAGYSNLGFCEELAEDPAAAEAAYRAGIAREPNNEPCHVNYGLMMARHGKSNEALLELQKVLTPAKAHYDLGAVYESQGKVSEAKVEYRQAVQLDPSLVDAVQKLASLGD